LEGVCSCSSESGVLDVVLVLDLHQMIEYMGIYRPIEYSRKY